MNTNLKRFSDKAFQEHSEKLIAIANDIALTVEPGSLDKVADIVLSLGFLTELKKLVEELRETEHKQN